MPAIVAVAAVLILAACSSTPRDPSPSTPTSRAPTSSAYASPQSRVAGRVLFTIEARDAKPKVAYIDSAGLHVIPLAFDGAPGHAVWDGPDHILFHGDQDGALHLYLAGLDGNGVTQVVGGADSQDSPAVSPDGSHIAYGEYQGAQDLGVHEANIDGSGVKSLTPATKPGVTGYDEPSFSPDGRWIAYKHIVDADQGLGELWVMRTDGTGARRLTEATTDASHPRFSPDSATILFTEHGDDAGQASKEPLWIIGTDGSNVRPLTDPADPGQAWNGDWSPDGSQVVFMCHVTGWTHNELRVADRDGSNVHTLWVSPTLASAESPDWSE